jgi:uncharacterized membrane protein
MFSDLNYILTWWLTIFCFSLVALPLTAILFSKFWDKGYIFAKIISITLVTYISFVLGVFKIVEFTNLSIIAIGLTLSFALYHYLPIKNYLVNWRLFLFEELIFLTILILWSYVRGFAPNIEGLEKFMDWGFVNSSLRSKYFPPIDMWFASEPINYYYFGHLYFALLTKVSTLTSAVTYNLSLATLCALTFVSVFSLTSNFIFSLAKKVKFHHFVIGGLFSALLLTFGGNLHSVYKIAKINIQTNGFLDLSQEAFTRSAQSYWYPDATRFIGFDPDAKDKTIHEFPLYSFVVSDLHGHVNGIPMVLLIIALLFSKSLQPTKKNIDLSTVIPLGFLLSLAFMTNAWDFAVYGLLFAISFFITRITDHGSLVTNVKKLLINGFLTIIAWYLFTLPFSLNFKPMADGLMFSDSHTPFYQLFILYGGFWLICFPFVFFIFKKFKSTDHGSRITDYFILSLILTATILIVIPEIGYIKDIYVYDHRRANTMFKLVYQAFMLYSLSAGYVFYRLRHVFVYRLVFMLVFCIHLIYPYFAVKSYYGIFSDSPKYTGLYGLNFLKDSYPDNWEAINWLNKNITGQPVILEAVGDSYTTFGQVSVATGLPTVQGWVVHEWLWRGGYEAPATRQTDVKTIYESEDLIKVRSLLQKYNVSYVFVGAKEYEKYPTLDPEKFSSLGAKVIFESGKTRIYQL